MPDQNAELVRLQSGQFDMMQQALRSEDLAALRPHSTPAGWMIDLGVSTDPDRFLLTSASPTGRTIRARLDHPEGVPQALSHAVDREAFANTCSLARRCRSGDRSRPGNTQWFSPNVPRYRLLATNRAASWPASA